MTAALANQTAAELRAAFDRTFAEGALGSELELEDVLTLTLGLAGYAVRLAEVAGLYADRKLVPVPSARSELLGIMGLRGELVPVYDLGALLGHAPLNAPRWFVIARAKGRVGFACAAADRLLRVARSEFSERPTLKDAPEPHIAGAVHIGNGLCPLIDLNSVVALVERAGALHARSGAR